MMDNRVHKIWTSTGEIAGHLVTGVYPHDNKISKDGQRVYNTSLGALASLPRSANSMALTETPGYPFQLTIADTATLAVRDRIQLENAFRPWQFSPDEKNIYAQLSNQHSVVTYDLAARRVVRRLDLAVKAGVTPADWDFEAPHHGLALTDDGQTLCLAARASDYAALVSAPDLTLIATIPVGDAPGWCRDGRKRSGLSGCEHAQRRPDDHFHPASRRDRAAADGQRPEAHHRRPAAGIGRRRVQATFVIQCPINAQQNCGVPGT
jgi:DNA-binding beta-propeller fold protein YncE